MTRNRNRKDKIRRSEQLTGARHAAAARQDAEREQRGCQIHDLLTEAAGAIGNADPGDVPSVLRRAWAAVCLIGAATEILSVCGDAAEDRSRRLLAQRPLAAAVRALRATPALRGAPAAVNPAGGPDDRLDGAAVAALREAVISCCDTLEQVMSRVPSDARPPSAARAAAVIARSTQAISRIYQAPAVLEPAGRAAASGLGYLPAGTPAELQAAIGGQLHELSVADPNDTVAALEAAWYGFSLVTILGQYLASRDPDAAVLHENALPVLARIIEVLDAAPSVPSGLHGLGLDTSPTADPAMMRIARRGIWDLTLAINALLSEAGRHARHDADRVAAETCTVLAAELADCYQGRLRTFLNPYGRQPGSGSDLVRGVPLTRAPRRARPASRPGLAGGEGLIDGLIDGEHRGQARDLEDLQEP